MIPSQAEQSETHSDVSKCEPDKDQGQDQVQQSNAEQLDNWTLDNWTTGEVVKKVRGCQQRRYLLETRGLPSTLAVRTGPLSLEGFWFSPLVVVSLGCVLRKALLLFFLLCSLFPYVSSVDIPFVSPFFPL